MLRPNQQRAKTAIIILWIIIGIKAITIISDYFQYAMIKSVNEGGTLDMETANFNDYRVAGILAIFVIFYIISAVTFINWFRRAYYNLKIRVPYLQYTDGWAAGSWFVPILNLYRPFNMLIELYTETNEILFKKFEGFKKLSISIIYYIWILWIISVILGQVMRYYPSEPSTIDDLMFITLLDMANSLIIMINAFFTLKMIENYSNVEPLLHKISDENQEELSLSLDSDTLD